MPFQAYKAYVHRHAMYTVETSLTFFNFKKIYNQIVCSQDSKQMSSKMALPICPQILSK